jgi:hypothetical protein
MRKTLILAGALSALAFPAAAHAAGPPTGADTRNAAQECRFERGSTAATREAFEAKYRTFGKCVSAKARDEARERDAAKASASQACRTERGTTKESRAAFEAKYGTGKNKRNAMGKCVSQAAKAAKQQADDADRKAAADRKSAAKQCASERGETEASRAAFAQKYGTNASKANAFGKCVSQRAKALQEDRD